MALHCTPWLPDSYMHPKLIRNCWDSFKICFRGRTVALTCPWGKVIWRTNKFPPPLLLSCLEKRRVLLYTPSSLTSPLGIYESYHITAAPPSPGILMQHAMGKVLLWATNKLQVSSYWNVASYRQKWSCDWREGPCSHSPIIHHSIDWIRVISHDFSIWAHVPCRTRPNQRRISFWWVRSIAISRSTGFIAALLALLGPSLPKTIAICLSVLWDAFILMGEWHQGTGKPWPKSFSKLSNQAAQVTQACNMYTEA